MAFYHEYDYIFAICMMFAALDAYNIGANDVANSFATSVSSRSLTMRQAMILAGLCEFLGAVLAGSRVTGTIKNGIISLSAFRDNAGMQMLGFTTALVTSASWLMFCTRNSWPVSTTYSLVSSLIGTGIALDGWGAPQWGWNGGKGLATIWAGMVIAPALAAGFASIVYLITKYAVLERANPIRNAMYISPLYFFTVACVLTMSIVYKGAPNLKLDKLSQTTVALAIVLTGLVVAILSALFWLPYVHAKVVKKDHTLRWFHFFYGPLLWKRPAPTEESNGAHVMDYRIHRDEPIVKPPQGGALQPTGDIESKSERSAEANTPIQEQRAPLEEVEKDQSKEIVGHWWLPRNLLVIVKYKILQVLLHGTSVDIHKLQLGDDAAEARIKAMHLRSKIYDNEVEHLYSFLQCMTACTNSFAHGSNDVSNAIGPLAAVYQVWRTSQIAGRNSETPVWVLVYGAAFIVIGLATYGYRIMAVMGNRLTMMSPSRGFSMELGASITVILASQYALPVSTTMCITGATMGVAIVSSGIRGFNWRGLLWIVSGWILTVPIAATVSACMLAIIINAPRF